MTIWLLRAVWFALPLAGGPAASDALQHLHHAPRVTALVLAWAAWALVLTATLAPRPVGLVAVRVAAPAAVVAALMATPHTSGVRAAPPLVLATVAAVVAGLPAIGYTFVNGASYGDEYRFPLRVPPGLWIGPVPLAAAVVVVGTPAGPLLVAAHHVVAGVVAVVVGWPAVFAAARSLHGLARRWAVVVPAGVVVHDPFTLTDPVLFPRDRVAALRVAGGDERLVAGGTDTLDLRLGAVGATTVLELVEDASIARARPGRRGRARAEMVEARRLLFAPTRPDALLASARRRRLRVP